MEQFAATFIQLLILVVIFFYTYPIGSIVIYLECVKSDLILSIDHRNIPELLVILSSNRLGFALFLCAYTIVF